MWKKAADSLRAAVGGGALADDVKHNDHGKPELVSLRVQPNVAVGPFSFGTPLAAFAAVVLLRRTTMQTALDSSSVYFPSAPGAAFAPSLLTSGGAAAARFFGAAATTADTAIHAALPPSTAYRERLRVLLGRAASAADATATALETTQRRLAAQTLYMQHHERVLRSDSSPLEALPHGDSEPGVAVLRCFQETQDQFSGGQSSRHNGAAAASSRSVSPSACAAPASASTSDSANVAMAVPTSLAGAASHTTSEVVTAANALATIVGTPAAVRVSLFDPSAAMRASAAVDGCTSSMTHRRRDTSSSSSTSTVNHSTVNHSTSSSLDIEFLRVRGSSLAVSFDSASLRLTSVVWAPRSLTTAAHPPKGGPSEAGAVVVDFVFGSASSLLRAHLHDSHHNATGPQLALPRVLESLGTPTHSTLLRRSIHRADSDGLPAACEFFLVLSYSGLAATFEVRDSDIGCPTAWGTSLEDTTRRAIAGALQVLLATGRGIQSGMPPVCAQLRWFDARAQTTVDAQSQQLQALPPLADRSLVQAGGRIRIAAHALNITVGEWLPSVRCPPRPFFDPAALVALDVSAEYNRESALPQWVARVHWRSYAAPPWLFASPASHLPVLRPGVTTPTDAVAALGAPRRVLAGGDGGFQLIYPDLGITLNFTATASAVTSEGDVTLHAIDIHNAIPDCATPADMRWALGRRCPFRWRFATPGELAAVLAVSAFDADGLHERGELRSTTSTFELCNTTPFSAFDSAVTSAAAGMLFPPGCCSSRPVTDPTASAFAAVASCGPRTRVRNGVASLHGVSFSIDQATRMVIRGLRLWDVATAETSFAWVMGEAKNENSTDGPHLPCRSRLIRFPLHAVPETPSRFEKLLTLEPPTPRMQCSSLPPTSVRAHAAGEAASVAPIRVDLPRASNLVNSVDGERANSPRNERNRHSVAPPVAARTGAHSDEEALQTSCRSGDGANTPQLPDNHPAAMPVVPVSPGRADGESDSAPCFLKSDAAPPTSTSNKTTPQSNGERTKRGK